MLDNLTFTLPFEGSGGSIGGISTAILLASISLYVFFYQLQKQKSHPDEPDIIAPAIPFVGHLLGMAMEGGRYVKGIGIRNKTLPIFTLPVPRSRIYVVTEPSLAAAVQRASRSLSFTPLVPDLTKRVLGLDAATVALVRRHLEDPDPVPDPEKKQKQPRGFLADIHDLVYAYLGPGERLNQLSLGAAGELAGQVNECVSAAAGAAVGEGEGEGEEVLVVNLLHWIRHFVTVATARFLYGPENPLSADPALEDAFWDFDHGLGLLLMDVFPAITARKPYRGRERLVAAMAEYLEQGRHRSASGIVQKRVEVALQHGWALRAVARSEVSFLFAGIVNTATTTFWTVLQLFANESGSGDGEGGRLLGEVRRELVESGAVTEAEDGEGGKKKRVLSLDRVKNGSSCPTLMAVFRECLRVGSDNYSTRLVKTDTVLAGRYFLKKDSVVQIAGGVIHADERIWGADASVFNPLRLFGGGGGGNGSKERGGGEEEENGNRSSHGNGTSSNIKNNNVHPAAFRAFGGGKTLCPGRHFATNEILAFVAMIVLTFDLEAEPQGVKGSGGAGQIRVPEKDDGVLPVHILEPKEDVIVRVRIRDGTRIEVI